MYFLYLKKYFATVKIRITNKIRITKKTKNMKIPFKDGSVDYYNTLT